MLFRIPTPFSLRITKRFHFTNLIGRNMDSRGVEGKDAEPHAFNGLVVGVDDYPVNTMLFRFLYGCRVGFLRKATRANFEATATNEHQPNRELAWNRAETRVETQK
jgi:hypothetical protein